MVLRLRRNIPRLLLLTSLLLCLSMFSMLQNAIESTNSDSIDVGRQPDVKLNVLSKIRIFPQGGEESTNTPPWPVDSVDVETNDDFVTPTESYIVGNISFSPGQGNIMFQYAALYALALRYNATLLLAANTPLRRAYTLGNRGKVRLRWLSDELTDNLTLSWNRTVLPRCCQYYPDVEHLSIERHTFFAYFQSFRYFHPTYSQQIRDQFTFLPVITQLAAQHVASIHSELRNSSSDCVNDSQHVLVGVHVRHGIDVIWNLRNIEHGHTVAPVKYFKRAMQHFRDEYGECVRFVMTSDDVRWCRDRFKDIPDLHIVETGTREVDMAVLVSTSHTIMSQGTFSWWIAYLTGGDVVYYSGWPRPGSTMDKMLKKQDYFLKEWIPMNA